MGVAEAIGQTEAVADVIPPEAQDKVEIQGRSKMPCDYSKYPSDWEWIRACILARARNRCELCNAENGKPHWKTGSKVVLTIAHLDQDIKNNEKYNLRALCQRCHNIIDLPYRIRKRKEAKEERPIRPERIDYMEKGARLFRPREGKKKIKGEKGNG